MATLAADRMGTSQTLAGLPGSAEAATSMRNWSPASVSVMAMSGARLAAAAASMAARSEPTAWLTPSMTICGV